MAFFARAQTTFRARAALDVEKIAHLAPLDADINPSSSKTEFSCSSVSADDGEAPQDDVRQGIRIVAIAIALFGCKE